jgi:hypothetical protein
VKEMSKRSKDIVNIIRNYMENNWPEEESRYINETKKFILYQLFGKEGIVEISDLDVILSEPDSPRSLQLRTAYIERRRQRVENELGDSSIKTMMEKFNPLDHLDKYGELLYISKILGGKFDYSETSPSTEVSEEGVSIDFETELLNWEEKLEKNVRIQRDFSSLTILQELIKNEQLTVMYRFSPPKSFSSFVEYSKDTTLQELGKTKEELKSIAMTDLMRLLENPQIIITFKSKLGQNILDICGTISPFVDLSVMMVLEDYSAESEELLKKLLRDVILM